MWAIKKLNFDIKIAREERLLQLNELEELRNEAYDNARIYKDKTKKWHDQRIMRKEFREGDQVPLFNSRLRLFPGKLKSKWSRPYTVMSSTTFGTITLRTDAGKNLKSMDNDLSIIKAGRKEKKSYNWFIEREKESKQQVQLRTKNLAANGRQPIKTFNF